MPPPTLLAPPNDVGAVDEHAVDATSTSTPTSRSTPRDRAVIGPIRRRTIDSVLVAAGAVVALVLVVAGGLLMWGHNFADDYVHDELVVAAHHVPLSEALTTEGRGDLAQYGGQTVDTGNEAEAYASYIGGHLDGIADGATYADLGTPERAAKADVQAAVKAGSPQATIDDLQGRGGHDHQPAQHPVQG